MSVDSSTPEDSPEKMETWISQKIQQLLLCDDKPINNLIQEGTALLNTFAASTDSFPVLFILIRKIILQPELPEPPIEKEEPIIEVVVKEEVKPVNPSIKVHKGLEEKIKAKKESIQTKQRTIIKNVTKPIRREKNKNRKQKPAKKKVKIEMKPQLETELLLEWQTQQQIPQSDQFIAIIPKLQVNGGDNSWDDRYHVIHIGVNRLFRNALSTAQNILEDELSFEMTITILLTFVGIHENRIPNHLQLERFIIFSICSYYCVDAPSIIDSSENDRSISLLLADAIHSYCSDQLKYDKQCLYLQLSFFDLEVTSFKADIKTCAARLHRAVLQLNTIFDIFGEEVREWLKKTFIYTTDLYATTLACHITAKTIAMFDYESNEKIAIAAHYYLPYIESCSTFNKKLFEHTDDSELPEKIFNSFKLIVLLEKEIERMTEKILKLYELESDLSVGKKTIKEKEILFKQMKLFLDENCLQSAIESANADTLNTIRTSFTSYNKNLNNIIYNEQSES